MSATAGNPIKPKDTGLNNLWATLETIRAKQLTAAQNAGESTTGLATAFSQPITSGTTAQKTPMRYIK